MAERKISDMPLLAQGDLVPSADYLPIVDISEASASNRNKRILANSLAMGAQFTQSGTDAVARTVQNKLRDALSAKDFGAVGDGVADDTAALQAAIVAAEAVGQGALHIPGGVYRTTAQLRIRRPIKLFGNGGGQGDISVNQRGTVISCTAAGQAAFYIRPESVVSPTAIWGLIIRDIGIYGNTVADGIVLDIDFQTISQSAFENIVMADCRDGIRGSSSFSSTSIYQNEFRNIKMYVCRRSGINIQDGAYNQFTNIEATMHSTATGYGFRFEMNGSNFADLMTEGPVSFNCWGSSVTGLHCEIIRPTNPAGGGNLIAVNGTGITLRNVTMANIDHNITNYGLVVYAANCTIDNVHVLGSDGPRYVWNPSSQSSGTLSNVQVNTTHYTAEQYLTVAEIYDNWRYVNASGASGVVNASDAFVQSGTGAVARSTQNKLRDVVSVKDFGAVCDGVADDTAAIQAALTAAGEGVVEFPASASIRVNNLTLLNYSKINGKGATLLPAAGATKILSIPRQNTLQVTQKSWIKDLNIDGLTTPSGLTGIDIDGHAALVLERVGVKNCDIGFNIIEAQFCTMHDCAAFNNNVGLLLKSKTASGGGNSWSFYDFRAVQNAVGIVLSKGAGSSFPFHSVYFRNPSILTNTVCGIAAFDVDHLCLDGGAPELNGSGASTYTVDGRTVKRSSMHFDGSRVEMVNTLNQEPTVTPCIILENSAHLMISNPTGYGNTLGRFVAADSTSSVDLSGHYAVRAVIEGVRRFEGTVLSSDGALLTTIFPQSAADLPNDIATSQKPGITQWTSPATANSDGTDAIFGDYNEGAFAASVGTTEDNRFLRLFTSAGAFVAVSFQIRASVATTVRICLYPNVPPRDFPLLAGVWHRVFFYTNAVASGTQYVLGFPLDAAGATIRLAKWQVFSDADTALNRCIAARIAAGAWKST